MSTIVETNTLERTIIKDKLISTAAHFNVRETLSYTWVGLVGISIDLALFLVFRDALDITPSLASFLSAASAATLTFPLNAHFTFQKKDNLKKRFLAYASINGFGTILGASLVFIGFNIIGLNDKFVKLIATVIVAATQFLLNKFVAFK